jgi:hypothetical protein
LDIDSGSLKNKIKNKVTLTPKQFNSLDHNNRYQRISLLFFVAKFHHMVTRKKESTTCTKDFGGGGGEGENGPKLPYFGDLEFFSLQNLVNLGHFFYEKFFV